MNTPTSNPRNPPTTPVKRRQGSQGSQQTADDVSVLLANLDVYGAAVQLFEQRDNNANMDMASFPDLPAEPAAGPAAGSAAGPAAVRAKRRLFDVDGEPPAKQSCTKW